MDQCKWCSADEYGAKIYCVKRFKKKNLGVACRILYLLPKCKDKKICYAESLHIYIH